MTETDNWTRIRIHVDDTAFLGFEKGSVLFAPPEELALHLGAVAHQIFTDVEGASNYVEWEVRTDEGGRYVLSISRSKEQRPSDLLAAVRKVVDQLGDERSPDVGYTASIIKRLNAAMRQETTA